MTWRSGTPEPHRLGQGCQRPAAGQTWDGEALPPPWAPGSQGRRSWGWDSCHISIAHWRAGPGWRKDPRVSGDPKEHGRTKQRQHLEKGLFPHRRGEGRKVGAALRRRGRGGPDPAGVGRAARPGRGRGGRSDAAVGGEGPEGCRRADREEGRGHGPALRLQRVRPLLESAAGAGGARGSDPRPVGPRPYRVRGVHPRLEVSRDVGGRADREHGGGRGRRGAEGSEGLSLAQWVRGGGTAAAKSGRRWTEQGLQGGGP